MDHFEKFEYFYLKEGKYQIGFFKEKTNCTNESKFRDFKFKSLQTLTLCFTRQELSGYPSNTGINGWSRQIIEINYLTIVWESNFSYENSTEGSSPRAKIIFKEKEIKIFQNINTTEKFVKILNYYIIPSNVIKLIELEYGIEKCYKKLIQNLDTNEALTILNS